MDVIQMSACGALCFAGWGLCLQDPRDTYGQMTGDPVYG